MTSAALRPTTATDRIGLPFSSKGWTQLPLFSVAQEAKRSNKGLAETNLLSLSYGEIVRKSMDTSDGLLPESFETYQVVEADDIVFRFTDLQNDKRSLRSARSPERGIITSAYVVVTPKRINPRFFAYLMRSYDTQKVFYGMGGGIRQSLRWDDVKRMEIAVPPSDLQRAIADYLDRETARIDTLIEKQERLIETLHERRRALITKSATEGVRHARLRPARSPFVGSIPAGWTESRLGLEMVIIGGQVDPRDDEWADVTLIAPNHIESDTGKLRSLETARDQGADSGKYRVHIGQILYSKIRPRLNKVAIAPSDCLCSADMYAMTSLRGESHEYFLYFMLSEPFLSYTSMISDRVKMPKVNREELSAAPWLRPPLAEQLEIVEYIRRQTATIDALISNAEEFITLTKERRSALITAAVTGQINVEEMANG